MDQTLFVNIFRDLDLPIGWHLVSTIYKEGIQVRLLLNDTEYFTLYYTNDEIDGYEFVDGLSLLINHLLFEALLVVNESGDSNKEKKGDPLMNTDKLKSKLEAWREVHNYAEECDDHYARVYSYMLQKVLEKHFKERHYSDYES